MKKTFISPVAEIVATEAQKVIAASNFGMKDETQKDAGGAWARGSNQSSNGGATGTGVGLDLETLDF